MDWWDSVELPRPDSNDGIKTRFICCPAQHGSGRGMHDQGATLWASWIVQEGGANVYHAGCVKLPSSGVVLVWDSTLRDDFGVSLRPASADDVHLLHSCSRSIDT